ncbi:ABC transporter substrate-binding protein [Streptomyces sp. NPDC050433]|uniref:ABC transporter substrate-binding protein n=1 Tax=Streptomyces sp. NPDC050433 TaxID=3365615 RepID=UPI0037B3198A
MSRRNRLSGTVIALSSLALLAACGSGDGSGSSGAGSTSASSSTAEAGVKQDKALHDALPADVRSKGTLTAAMVTFPPYVTYKADGTTLEGASIDLAAALSDLLGVKVEPTIVPDFSQAVTGIQSGRYDFGLGPYADNADTAKNFDFVDWIQEFVVFAVPKGNPGKVTSLGATCGHSIAVLAGGSAETVLKKQSGTCVSDGEKAVEIKSFQDANSAVLAVRSGRAQAYFSSRASLVYFIDQTKGALELAGTDGTNGFDNLRQGSFFGKKSEMTQPILNSLKKLQSDGTLSTIMKKWKLGDNELKTIGVNLSTTGN